MLDPNAALAGRHRLACSSGRRRPTASCWRTACRKAAPTGGRFTSARSTRGKDLIDEVKWMRFSELSWTKDSKGFFYSRYPEPPEGQGAARRRSPARRSITTASARRSPGIALIYERKDCRRGSSTARRTEDGRYCSIFIYEGIRPTTTASTTPICGDPLRPDIAAPVKPLVEDDDAEFTPFGNRGPVLYMRTDRGAPNRQVIAIDVNNPSPSATGRRSCRKAREAIESVGLIGGRIVGAVSRRRAEPAVALRPRWIAGRGRPVAGRRHRRLDAEAARTRRRSSTSSARRSRPTTVYSYDPASKVRTPFDAPVPPIDVSRYETTTAVRHLQGWHEGAVLPDRSKGPGAGRQPSDDDVRLRRVLGQHAADLPLGRAGVAGNGRHLGHGEHARRRRIRARRGTRRGTWRRNRTSSTTSSPSPSIWSRRATPRRHVWASWGGSNGGLLVGVVEQQRPDLFAVAVPAVGVMDMLRYDKFTGGRAWVTEYGSSTERRAVRVPHQVLAAAERQARLVLSGHAGHHRGSRRPRRAEPLLQVCGGDAGRAGVRQADPDSRRDWRLARLSSDRQAYRRTGGPVGVRRRPDEDRGASLADGRVRSAAKSHEIARKHVEVVTVDPLHNRVPPVVHRSRASRTENRRRDRGDRVTVAAGIRRQENRGVS